MIRAILFDFGQTLADSSPGFRQAEKAAEASIFADAGCRDWTRFLEVYRQVRQEFSRRRPGAPRQAAWEEVYSLLQCRPDPRALRDREVQYWQTVIAGTKLFPESTEVLEVLSRRFVLGVVSNTQGEIDTVPHRINHCPEVIAAVDCIVVAGSAGVPAKPHPAPFHACLSGVGAIAEEAIYVGDDWHVDIQGAKSAGISPIWLQHQSVQRRWPPGDGTVPIIHTLTDLLALEAG